MNSNASKTLAAGAIAVAMLGFGPANQAFATISGPPTDQKALVSAIIVVAPASVELRKDSASTTKAPLIRVAPHACGAGGCMDHEDHEDHKV